MAEATFFYWHQRPTDLPGVLALIEQLIVDGQVCRHAAEKSRQETDLILESWRRRRGVVAKWARAVVTRLDPERAETFGWQLASVNRMWRLGDHSDAEMELTERLLVDLRLWRDEVALLSEPDTGWLLEAGRPFSAWELIRDVLSAAKSEVWLCDPYVDRATLSLLRTVDPTVHIRLLGSEEEVVKHISAEDWQKWNSERGGSAELRSMVRAKLSHDRFLGVDDHVYLSGASFKDLGKRTSLLVPVTAAAVARATRGTFEEQWDSAASRP